MEKCQEQENPDSCHSGDDEFSMLVPDDEDGKEIDRQKDEAIGCHYLSEKQRNLKAVFVSALVNSRVNLGAVCQEVLKTKDVAVLYVWSESCLYTYKPNEGT